MNTHARRWPAPRSRLPIAWCSACILAALAVAPGHCDSAQGVAVADAPAWSASVSIWFFSGRAELDAAERLKIAALAARSHADPGLEFGIHRPVPVRAPEPIPGSVPDPIPESLGPRRLVAIHDAMVAAGIPADHIHIGDYGGRAYDVDRRTVIFVRLAQPSREPPRPGGEDDDVAAD